MNQNKVEKIARKIMAMATIYQQDKYKVSVYPVQAEGSHKKSHVSVVVSRGDETGNIAINDGEVLNGNLSPQSVNWCRTTVLTEENKKRILKMLSDDDYYRLDRPNEVAAHPLETQKNNKTAYLKTQYKWEDTLITSVEFVKGYKYRITFADGKQKEVDLSHKITEHPKVFRQLIDHPEIASQVKVEDGGTGIYWDDVMGYPCDWLYEIGKEK